MYIGTAIAKNVIIPNRTSAKYFFRHPTEIDRRCAYAPTIQTITNTNDKSLLYCMNEQQISDAVRRTSELAMRKCCRREK